MKKIYILPYLFCLLFFFQQAYSQNSANLVLFAEAGEKLQLTINGDQINPGPNGQIRVDNLPPGFHKVRINIFWGNNYQAEIIKTIALDPFTETYYNVKRNNKNEWVLRMSNQVQLQQPQPQPQPNPYPQPEPVPQPQPQPYPVPQPQPYPVPQPRPVPPPGNNDYRNNNQPQQNPNNQNYLPGYNGPLGCPFPMSPEEMAQIKSAIASKSFESTKLTIAKQVLANRCILSGDVRDIMNLFSFESTKLEFAKFAYDWTYDIGNYYLLYNAFNFESSITDLSDYVKSRPVRNFSPNQPAPVYPGRCGAGFQYSGTMGCQTPMSDADFAAAKASIGSKSYDSSRLTIAKQVLTNNCLMARDVKELMQLFSYEDTRLNFAKFAYAYTMDQNNYFVVNDAFQYESSISALNNYIKNR